jgi:ribosomal protein S18 acetylase RimI-like enzyme
MEIEIRRLEPGDEDVVQRLSANDEGFDVLGRTTAGYPVPDRATASRLLNADYAHHLVAFDGEEPVGHLLAYELLRRHGDEPKMHLYEIGVREDYRRRGIGRRLVEHFAELCRERGARRAFVLTDEANEAAMAFYAAAGGERRRDDDVVFFFEF